jgi:hypothetical protein
LKKGINNPEVVRAVAPRLKDAWKLKFMDSIPSQRPTAPKVGLGDLVEKVAQPIAKAIDRVFKTNVQGCGGCRRRKAALNRLVPEL